MGPNIETFLQVFEYDVIFIYRKCIQLLMVTSDNNCLWRRRWLIMMATMIDWWWCRTHFHSVPFLPDTMMMTIMYFRSVPFPQYELMMNWWCWWGDDGNDNNYARRAGKRMIIGNFIRHFQTSSKYCYLSVTFRNKSGILFEDLVLVRVLQNCGRINEFTRNMNGFWMGFLSWNSATCTDLFKFDPNTKSVAEQ